MSGSFPEDVHLLPYGGATCLWPVGMAVHGCSLALSSDRSGQGAYGGVSSPPSRDPQCADPSSHKHPQLSCLSPDGPIVYPAGWLRKCLTIGIRESQPVSLMKLPMAYMCVGLVILQGRVR